MFGTIFFYIIQNEDFKDDRNKYYKYGITNKIENRLNDYHTYSPNRFEYIKVYKLNVVNSKFKVVDNIFSKWCKDINKLHKLELNFSNSIVFEKLNNYLLDKGGGVEFVYEEGLQYIYEIINNEFDKFGIQIVEEYDKKKIENLNNSHIQYIKKKKQTDDDKYFDGFKELFKMDKSITFQNRLYQTVTRKLCINELEKNKKMFLELATGAGKTYILFTILKYFSPNIIVIFSPRIKINEQNIDIKYINLLNKSYEILNMSTSTKLVKNNFFKSNKKKIIVCCSQSSKKLYEYINKYKIKNIFSCFDEAHWSFGEWLNDEQILKYKENLHRQFWLNNNTNIEYRIFISASPNKKIVKLNTNLYGNLCNPISVKELIEQKWLCPAISFQFAYPKDKDDINIINYILINFENDNRNWGFSFHSKRMNAFNLFYQHFKKYKNNETTIKPFLLIGDDFYNIFKDDFEIQTQICDTIEDVLESKLKLEELKNVIKELKTKYIEVEKYYNDNKQLDSYKDILEYEKNINSIGYVVQKYTLGYDFKGIDYIIIADNKMSYQDIIQCLGRGFRSDLKGIGGKNLDKKLHIHIPVYYDNVNNKRKYSFKEIKNVLIYLLTNTNINFEKLFMNFNTHFKSSFNTGHDNKGQDEMKKQLIDLYYDAQIFKKKRLESVYKICVQYNIDTLEKYNNFIKKNDFLNLCKNIYNYNGFKWKHICDSLNKNYYDTLEECEEQITIIKNNQKVHLSITEYRKFIKKLNLNRNINIHNSYDKRIPPFYKLNDYYP
jgi:superfamily II DNA or RNA helicase